MKNRGRACPCGGGRGFRTEHMARHVYRESTQHLGLTRAHDFHQCEHGQWHWGQEEPT